VTWPKDEIPEEYLSLALRLIKKSFVTKREFIDLCKMAVKLVDAGQTTVQSRADMFYYITNLWFRYDNIDDGSITSDIGTTFGAWEVPGSLDLSNRHDIERWEELKAWVSEADKKYKTEQLSDHQKDVPKGFLATANRLLDQKNITEREYVDLCLAAIGVIDSGQSTKQARKNVAFYLAEIANRHQSILDEKLLGQISAKFSVYDTPDAFNLGLILEKHSWEELKVWVFEADKMYRG
jgi:hypothetical protein